MIAPDILTAKNADLPEPARRRLLARAYRFCKEHGSHEMASAADFLAALCAERAVLKEALEKIAAGPVSAAAAARFAGVKLSGAAGARVSSPTIEPPEEPQQ